MKRFFFAIVVIAIIVYTWSCSKSTVSAQTCTGPTAVSDSIRLLAFARSHGIAPIADTSWLYYQIIDPGTGASPAAASKVYVRYAARLMDGTYFDSTATAIRFALDSLIKGWQYGLPKIKAGGRIKLLVPSALGYGCAGAGGVIPPDAPLYFDIYLDSLK
ncbi:MAG: hypothetical protein NVSMB7_16840 [Chitinophagaceae bacterium]